MSRMVPRRAVRSDDSRAGIVQALVDLGAHVEDIGYPIDLFVGFRGVWLPMELKNPGGEPKLDKRNGKTYRRAAGSLTEAQERFIAKAAKHGLPAPVASTPEEAVAFVLAATRTNAVASRGKPTASAPTAGPEATGNHKPCPRCINSPHTPEG